MQKRVRCTAPWRFPNAWTRVLKICIPQPPAGKNHDDFEAPPRAKKDTNTDFHRQSKTLTNKLRNKNWGSAPLTEEPAT